MITSKDSEFHPVRRDNWRWTETTPLTFSIPEAGILGNLYIAARPNLGVALSSVGIVQGFRFNPFEMDFSDAQMLWNPHGGAAQRRQWQDDYENLRNGFVMEDGAVYGLVSATVEGYGVEFLAEQRSRSASAG